MNKRILTVVMTAAVVATTSGCAPFRNFFFGRGAQCGLCTRLSPPRLQGCRQDQVPPRPYPPQVAPCPQQCRPAPVYTQPQPMPPGGNCGCNPGYGYSSSYSPAYGGETCGTCNADPYSGAVIGTGISGDNFVPRMYDEQGVQVNYPPGYDTGYRLDSDGARIISEDPMPPGATVVGQ